MKKVTIRDIAAVAGVSCATVSRSLANSSSISEQTKQKVRRVSQELGYSPNYVSLLPNSPGVGMIGMIVPDISDPKTAALIDRVESCLEEMGLSLLLCSSRGDRDQEKRCFERLLRLHADGVLLIPVGEDPVGYLAEQLEQIPTVVLGKNLQYATQSYVAPDWRGGAALCVSELRRKGIKKILLLGEERLFANGQAASAFRKACAEGQTVLSVCCAAENTYEEGRKQLQSCLTAETEGTAVIASSRNLAEGALAAQKDWGNDGCVICIGEDCRGVDVLVFPPEEMAKHASRILMDQISSDIDGFSHILVRPQLRSQRADSQLGSEV